METRLGRARVKKTAQGRVWQSGWGLLAVVVVCLFVVANEADAQSTKKEKTGKDRLYFKRAN
jgi:hypothetical protein